MTCPPEIAVLHLRILEQGLLRARAAAWAGDAARSAREIDHVHNLPALIAEFSPDRFSYYWEIERGEVLAAERSGDGLISFDALWQQLDCQMEMLLTAGRTL